MSLCIELQDHVSSP